MADRETALAWEAFDGLSCDEEAEFGCDKGHEQLLREVRANRNDRCIQYEGPYFQDYKNLSSSDKADFFEELHVKQFDYQPSDEDGEDEGDGKQKNSVVQLPCILSADYSTPTDKDKLCYEQLLREHEASLAAQRQAINPMVLSQTFAPLLKFSKKMRGFPMINSTPHPHRSPCKGDGNPCTGHPRPYVSFT